MKVLLILLSLIPFAGNACLWFHGTTIDGSSLLIEGRTPASILKNSTEGTPEEKIRNLLLNRDSKNHEEFILDEFLALEEIAKGNYDAAISILKKIESENPGVYSVAANLGTVYELKGDLHRALEWISESIQRNSDSHYGSEWLHEVILKEKIRMRDYGSEARVSDFLLVPQEFDSEFKIQVSGKEFTPQEVAEAIFYQLNERMVFVKPEDPIVAELLFDYAMIEANTRVLESSIEILDLADLYGFPNVALIEEKKMKYQKTIDIAKRMPFVWGALAIIIFLFFLFYAYRKKWFFLSSVGYKKYKQEKIQQAASDNG